MRWILALILSATLAGAQDKAAGNFDHYVLALSWTPGWCASEGDARRAPECAIGRARAFSLHGLWPQNQTGWPEFCRTPRRDPTRAQTAAMADIMGSGGLAWYQWRKHGRCSGLDGPTYLALSRAAYARITIPPVLAGLNRDVRLPAKVVEAAFLEANPDLTPDMITITCRDGRIAEARICLTRDLDPRLCAPDSRRDCALSAAIMDGVR
jgi:ribonuclease T2